LDGFGDVRDFAWANTESGERGGSSWREPVGGNRGLLGGDLCSAEIDGGERRALEVTSERGVEPWLAASCGGCEGGVGTHEPVLPV
jgi:hypothetical protein